MRAIAVRTSGDTPELMDLPVPSPGSGEILVELTAAALNPMDAGIAAGFFNDRMTPDYPMIVGVDGAGVVTRTGDGANRFAEGDVVHGQFFRAPLGHGTFADYSVVTEFPNNGALQRVPDGIPADVAAALPTAGMTAMGAIDTIAPRAGQTVLIVGATGGVGVFAVQLATALGAEVIATARPDADQWLRRLGAARTVDYTTGDIADQVGRVDAVLDLMRDEQRFRGYAALVRDGGSAVSATFTAPPDLLASRRITVTNFGMRDKPDLLERVTGYVVKGQVTVPIQAAIALEDVPDALRRVTGGGARGKTSIRIR
jgi:NADPH:quinone reductase